MSQIMNLIYPSQSRTFRFQSRSLIFNVNIIDNFPSDIDLAQVSADGLYQQVRTGFRFEFKNFDFQCEIKFLNI